jgi:glycosyltransferase involved in cell wall biosynthesis
MTRLLYLTADPGVPVLGHKGASVHVRELARALDEGGAKVLVLSPRIAQEGDRLSAGVALREIPPVLPKRRDELEIRRAMQAQADAVLAAATTWPADAIYERFSLFTDAGARAAHALGIPHVLEVNAPLRAEAARYRTLPHAELALAVERQVLGGVTQVLTVSAGLVEHLTALGVPRSLIQVVPNGVSAVASAPTTAHPDEFVVGFAGSLKPWHGVTTLLAACVLAAPRIPGLTLEVIGHGPLADDVTDAAVAPARLRVLGALPHAQTLDLMANWDVGAAPYAASDDFYFSPLKVLEYMAAGVCPVASALGELPVLLGGGARGVLVAPDDPAALAGALVGLAADPVRRRQLGVEARTYVQAHRSWAVNARTVLQAVGALEPVPRR